jgi:Leucine-rich repeat (LRR) protein
MPHIRTIFCLCAFTCGLGFGQAAEPFPRDVAEAWAKAGARIGWYGPDSFDFPQFSTDGKKLNPQRKRPAFHLESYKEGTLQGLPQPKEAFALSFRNSNVTDTAMKEVVGLGRLVELDLRGTQIRGAGIAQLTGLKNLQTLHLEQMDDATLLALGKAGRLHWLIQARANNQAQAKKGSEVTSLSLFQQPISSEALKYVHTLPNLTNLHLGHTKITGSVLEHLKELTKLQHLDLSYTDLTDDDWKKLENLKSLRYLRLGNSRATNSGLKHLAKLKNLEHLDMGQTPLTPEALETLATMTHLKFLILKQTRIGTATATELQKRLPHTAVDH